MYNFLSYWWITGFTDAEGCFRISILKNKEFKTKWKVKAHFQIALHKKDKALLELIQLKLKIGKIYTSGSQAITFEVFSIKELEVIIAHFNKYPLISKKRADYELFKLAVSYIQQGLHLTMEGLIKIISIKASINRSLSDELKTAFPDIVPIPRPLVQNLSIPSPEWVSGFTSGDGCFIVKIKKYSTHRLGIQVELIFQVTQHIRDVQLLLSLKDYLCCGKYR